MTIIEVMGSRSTKYGGVESFMYKLVADNPKATYHFIYNEYPRSEHYVKDLLSYGSSIHVINTEGIGYIRNVRKFLKLLKDIKPDVVHFHFTNAHCLWGPLCKIKGVKRVFKTMHSCLFQNGKQAGNISEMSLQHRFITLWGKIYGIYDRVFCVSRFVEKQHIQVYGNFGNTEISYLGTIAPKIISTEYVFNLKRKYNIDEETKVLLSIMFADPIKGCDILIKALPNIKGKFKLLLIGMDESAGYTKLMHKLAKNIGVEDKIVWVGITDEVYKYMCISDIYIQPSRTEALSLAAVEAMSHGLPIVATNTGGLPEVASSLFEYEDHIGLADIVTKLLHDEIEYKKQSERSKNDWNSNFSMGNSVSRYIALYSS